MDSRQLLRELPRRTLFGLGALAALRAVALVILADGVASAISALAAGRTDIVPACALAAAGGLARALLGWALSASTARAAAREKARQREALIDAVADGRASGAEVATLATTGLDALDDFWLSTVPAAVGAATVPLVVGLRILTADWLSALIVVITLPLVPIFMILIGMHSRDRTAEATTALERLADYLVDLAAGLPVLVGLGRVGEQRRALARVQQRYSARTRQTLRTALLSALALELIGTISVAVVAVSLGIRLLNHSVALEPALLALLLAPECFAAVREVGAAFHSSQRGLTVLDRVRGLLGTPSRSREGSGREIVLDLKSLRYADRDAAPVGPIALRVAPGTITALVGPSGSGKSSALAALTGTLPADAVLEGAAVAPASIAVARQDPRFSATTVRAELELHGDGGPELARRLGLGALLDADPVSLSPGEQRRLAVARALLRVDEGAEALLLDEPTAHLDSASAAALLAELDARRGRCAILLATHDPDAIGIADDVVRVVRRGVSPDETPVSTDSVPFGASDPEHGDERDPERVGSSRWRWIASCALAILAAGFALALTGVSGWLIVRASQGPAIMYLLVAIVGVRFFGIGRAALRYSERLVEHDAALRMTDALRLRLWSAIAARGTGSRRLLEGGTATDFLVVRLERMRDLLPRVIPPIAASLVCALGVIVVAALVTPTALPLTIGCLLVAAIAGPAVAMLVDRRAVLSTEEARSRLARELGALGHAAVELRINGVADRAAVSARDAAETARAAEQRAALGSGLGVALVVLACSTLAALAPLAAATARPELAAVTALLGLALVDPLLAGAQAAQRAPGLLAAQRALRPLLSAPPERTDGGSVDERLETVELVDVGIRWPGADRLAVSGVNAVLDRSAWTVLDGPSGSGKSTILSGVLGAIDPVEGRIEYDGVPGALLAPSAIRTHVAWCPQDAHVFDSTLRGNLLISRPREDPPSDPAMRTALHRVGLGAFAGDLETRIGRDGSRLSGGERQRLAVARALLSPAETLLLDEPTAHLDAATAADMMDDVRSSTEDRIVVLVSHRAEDRRETDHIVATDAVLTRRAPR